MSGIIWISTMVSINTSALNDYEEKQGNGGMPVEFYLEGGNVDIIEKDKKIIKLRSNWYYEIIV